MENPKSLLIIQGLNSDLILHVLWDNSFNYWRMDNETTTSPR